MSIGLALSGGGAKGAAHIGVLQALKESNINVDYISGTSSGSIIATLYALGYQPFDILRMFNTYCREIADYDRLLPLKLVSTLFTGKIGIKGLAKGDKLESLIQRFCMVKQIRNINEVDMPLAIPTVDLNTGETLYFLSKELKTNTALRDNFDDIPTYKYSGNLASIVRASSSFPCVFEPKIIDTNLLIDGGVRVNTPVLVLRKMGADVIIACTFDKNDKCSTYNTNIISIAMKAFDIMGHQINVSEIENADIVIRPNIEDVGLLDFAKTNTLARQGYIATKMMLKRTHLLS